MLPVGVYVYIYIYTVLYIYIYTVLYIYIYTVLYIHSIIYIQYYIYNIQYYCIYIQYYIYIVIYIYTTNYPNYILLYNSHHIFRYWVKKNYFWSLWFFSQVTLSTDDPLMFHTTKERHFGASEIEGTSGRSHGCVWKWLVPLNPMVLLIIIPIKWLFHWEYTLFSDKPTYVFIYPIGSMYGIYANMTGVYGWDPCYHV